MGLPAPWGWCLQVLLRLTAKLTGKGFLFLDPVNQDKQLVCEIQRPGDGDHHFHHATENRRTVVSFVNRAATSGRAFFRAVASSLAVLTGFQVIFCIPRPVRPPACP